MIDVIKQEYDSRTNINYHLSNNGNTWKTMAFKSNPPRTKTYKVTRQYTLNVQPGLYALVDQFYLDRDVCNQYDSTHEDFSYKGINLASIKLLSAIPYQLIKNESNTTSRMNLWINDTYRLYSVTGTSMESPVERMYCNGVPLYIRKPAGDHFPLCELVKYTGEFSNMVRDLNTTPESLIEFHHADTDDIVELITYPDSVDFVPNTQFKTLADHHCLVMSDRTACEINGHRQELVYDVGDNHVRTSLLYPGVNDYMKFTHGSFEKAKHVSSFEYYTNEDVVGYQLLHITPQYAGNNETQINHLVELRFEVEYDISYYFLNWAPDNNLKFNENEDVEVIKYITI